MWWKAGAGVAADIMGHEIKVDRINKDSKRMRGKNDYEIS